MRLPKQDEPTPERTLTIVRRLVSDTLEADRRALLAWAEELLRIRESTLPVSQKARSALRRRSGPKSRNPFFAFSPTRVATSEPSLRRFCGMIADGVRD